jgi:hypothetical protein
LEVALDIGVDLVLAADRLDPFSADFETFHVVLFRLCWKWRERSAVKITERTP